MNCPYLKRSCATLDPTADLNVTAHGWLHRHDHRDCQPTMRVESRLDDWRWRHPLDPDEEYHAEPALYMSARDPLQKRYPAPWQVVASSLLLCKTSRRQAEAVAAVLFSHVKEPHHLLGRNGQYAVVDLKGICRPLGMVSNRVRYLRELGARWPSPNDVMPVEFVADLLGCGQYVIDAYRIFALGETPEGVTDKVLALHLELYGVQGVLIGP